MRIIDVLKNNLFFEKELINEEKKFLIAKEFKEFK